MDESKYDKLYERAKKEARHVSAMSYPEHMEKERLEVYHRTLCKKFNDYFRH